MPAYEVSFFATVVIDADNADEAETVVVDGWSEDFSDVKVERIKEVGERRYG
jgi:hypothetical protein